MYDLGDETLIRCGLRSINLSTSGHQRADDVGDDIICKRGKYGEYYRRGRKQRLSHICFTQSPRGTIMCVGCVREIITTLRNLFLHSQTSGSMDQVTSRLYMLRISLQTRCDATDFPSQSQISSELRGNVNTEAETFSCGIEKENVLKSQ